VFPSPRFATVVSVNTTLRSAVPAPYLQGQGDLRAVRWTAYAAFAWVMVFLAWHVVWAATGLAIPSTAQHHGSARVLMWVSTVVVLAMVAVGTALPLALAQAWGRRIPRPVLLSAAWMGCVLLGARGLMGVGDDVVRATGILPNGLTGLTMEQVSGTAHPSAWELFAGGFTDLLFAGGGLAFGLAALAYQRARRPHAAQHGSVV
jgi:hypothetical protein